MPFLPVGIDCSAPYSFALPEVGEMSSSGDRTAYLKYCVSGPKTCICFPKTIGIDPANNVVCLDPSCSTLTADISGQTVVADISGQTVIADISGQTIGIDPSNNQVTLSLSGGAGDAFGRLRVSNPYTLFEFNSINGKQPLIIDEQITGTSASSTWVNGDSYINMSVTGAGQSVIRQSHDYILYQPGKSKLILMTGVLYTVDTPAATSQLTTRIGCYDTVIGGVYIQMNNGTISINLVKNTGTSLSSSVSRDSWDDPLDGTGPSGITIEFNKAQIFMFDMEWLGVGQVRCGIVQAGQFVYYHTFKHVNVLDFPYVQMAKLPMRYEIISTGSANSMRMICGSVSSEGGLSPIGRQFTASIDTSGVTVTNSTFVPIMSLSLRTDVSNPYNRGTIKIKNLDIFNTNTNSVGVWKLVMNPTITGSPGWSDPFDSARESIARVRYDNGLGTITNQGRVIYQGYYSTRSNEILFTSIDEMVAFPGIASNIAGTPDVIVLIANWLVGSGSSQIYAGLRWLELM